MNNYQPYFNTGELIAKHLRNELTVEEKSELEQWLKSDPQNLELFIKLLDESLITEEIEIFSPLENKQAWETIVKNTGFQKSTTSHFKWRRLLPYAAAIFILIASGIFISRYFLKKEQPKTLSQRQPDFLPGSKKAILTLANGSRIFLDSANQGRITNQRNVEIKIKNGQVIYFNEDDNAKNKALDLPKILAMNTLTTPRGGQFEVVLPDGTRVWLNAASSLTYPVEFSGRERRVELTGEGYFEVAKNADKPFFVKTSDQTVEVLGTHFNINCYADENAVKTTLLEGSVKITSNSNGQTLKIKPGQQSINTVAEINVLNGADTDEAVAWKNGNFLFRNTDLLTVMRQLCRWYDVDVEYQGTIVSRHYQGRISRNVPVSQVFEILKTSGINFIINGRTIIVK